MLEVTIAIAFFVVMRFIVYYAQLWSCMEPTDIWMKYDQFAAVYAVDPKHFKLYNFHEYGPCVQYDSPDRFYYIYFKSLPDWIRAKLLLTRAKKSGDNTTRTISTLKFLEEIKSKLPKEN